MPDPAPLAVLLAEALDLCVRARKLDEQDMHAVMRENFELTPDHPASRSLTPWLWVRNQYDRDLADWETRARKALMERADA